MRKFHEIYKEKQNKAIELFENQVLNDFKDVYSTLLEKYGITDFYALNEEEQVTLLAELKSYWSEEEGVSEKGKRFLQIRSDVSSESSTSLQKKNFFKNKASVIINETIRQSNLKWKLYDVIDEMYNEIQASSVQDILSPDIISDIIQESVKTTLENFIKEIRIELNESAKEVAKNKKRV
jgi:histone H3/H4